MASKQTTRSAPPRVADAPDELQGAAPDPIDDADGIAGEIPQDDIGTPPDGQQDPVAAGDALRKLREANALAEAAPPLSALATGQALPAPRIAPTRQAMAASQPVYASQVFPGIFPYESKTRPGVWVDPKTGQPIAPRFRTGGQFSLRHLVVKNTLTGQVRETAISMAVPPGSWPVRNHETCQSFEVIFDFEDDRDLVAKMYGVKRFDPLSKNNDGGAETMPGLLGLKQAAFVG